MTPNQKALHERALAIAQSYRRSESELLDIIQKLDDKKVFRALGYSSLFQYCLDELKLSEANSYSFIRVARKAKTIPEMKQEIKNGNLTVSKAQKVVAIVNNKNVSEWLRKAIELPCRKLEREVAIALPQQEVLEKTKYLSGKRLKLELGIDENLYEDLIRIIDILSQKTKKAISTEEALKAMAQCFKEKYDPQIRANRILAKKNKSQEHGVHVNSSKVDKSKDSKLNDHDQHPKNFLRKPLPAFTKHQVIQNSNSQCEYIQSNGKRCLSKRWLEIHHRKPIAMGGRDHIDNLQLLCFSHHQMIHEAHRNNSQKPI